MKNRAIVALLLALAMLLPMLSACATEGGAEASAPMPTESETETTAPTESGEISAPIETEATDPGESGGIGEAIIPEEEPIEKPENPTKSLFAKSNESYNGGKLGCTGLIVKAEYNTGVDFDIYSYKDSENKIYYLFLPCRADLSALTFTAMHKDGRESGPYTVDFSDTEVGENEKVIGGINTYSIIVMKSDLPTVMIEIDQKHGTIKNMNGDRAHETYCYGEVVATVTDEMASANGWATKYASVDVDEAVAGSMKIRGRGNATWSYAKKPYHMVIENDLDLLGMGSANKFVLMANVKDAAGIRNELALSMGQMIGIDYTSDFRKVDLFMNGEYLGMYTLAEKVETGINRVEIDHKDDILFEKDNYATDEEIFGFHSTYITANKRGFRIVSPEDESMVERCKSKILIAESALYSRDDELFAKYFDLESWAKMYLLQTYTMNSDAYYGSLYFYYNGDDGKLYACSPWDFDWSLGVSWGGSSSYTDPMKYTVNNIEWINPMLSHKNFIEALVKVYYEGGAREVIGSMPALAEQYGNDYRNSALMNQIVNDVYYFPKDIDNHDDSVAYVHDICEKRVEYVESQMQMYAQMVKYDIK